MTDRPAPFSLRLTREERARLERDAGSLAVGAYIRARLFDPDVPQPRRQSRSPIKDHQALAQVLGLLGQLRIANNLNQIAKAAHLGTLPVGPELDADLQAALVHVRAIRQLLITALNLSDAAP